MTIPQTIVDKFDTHLFPQPDGCIYYDQTKTKAGYKLILWKESLAHFGGTITAHRLSYLIHNGEIPDGYVIDHECHNQDPSCPNGEKCHHRRCVNPEHLVARTTQENVRRGNIKNRVTRPNCPSGHEFTEENTFYIGNSRRCKECNRLNASKHYVPLRDPNYCPNGHLYTEETTRTSFDKGRGRMRRRCLVCVDANREKHRESRNARRRKGTAQTDPARWPGSPTEELRTAMKGVGSLSMKDVNG